MEATVDLGRSHVFANRREAGRELAAHLQHYKDRDDVVVLALPRGGVPVAYEVARSLAAPLDVFLVRKLGAPGRPELAMGAIASGGVRVLNDDVLQSYKIDAQILARSARDEQAELERQERAYRNGGPPLSLRDRIAVIVDDGLATGSTMRAAVEAIRAHRPARIVVAVPVGAPETCRMLTDVADEVICARAPRLFSAVGQWYLDFSPTSEAEVRTLLNDVPVPGRRAG